MGASRVIGLQNKLRIPSLPQRQEWQKVDILNS